MRVLLHCVILIAGERSQICYPCRMQSFGKNLSKIRTARGLTRSELARMSGVSRQLIDGYERGEESRFLNPSYVSVARLAKALGVEVAKLAGKLNNA
jgi:transcriptional regulator with XRE-family HTH domain